MGEEKVFLLLLSLAVEARSAHCCLLPTSCFQITTLGFKPRLQKQEKVLFGDPSGPEAERMERGKGRGLTKVQ